MMKPSAEASASAHTYRHTHYYTVVMETALIQHQPAALISVGVTFIKPVAGEPALTFTQVASSLNPLWSL